jgi:PIN domain nuclease of toxin-antitoxin system
VSSFLVDTHAVLWFLIDDPQLSPQAKRTMESADSVLLVSAACVWEIAIKTALGKLSAPPDLPAVLSDQGFDTIDITVGHAWRVATLPVVAHKDPFDRLLVAQALVEDLAIISSDAGLDAYGVDRHW